MPRRISTATLLAGLVIGVTGASLVSSSSAGPTPASPMDRRTVAGAAPSASTTVRVHGTRVPVHADMCIYGLRGDLVGRWTFIPKQALPHTPRNFVEPGVGRFNVCLDRNHDKTCAAREPNGVLRAAYLSWASFDGHGNLVRGRCVHPVTGGTSLHASRRPGHRQTAIAVLVPVWRVAGYRRTTVCHCVSGNRWCSDSRPSNAPGHR